MPNPQNRNNRRKREEHSETLIIPHITKEMLEKARTMAAQGASRAEIEQAIAEMQGTAAPKTEAAPASKPQPEPDARRIIPTSRKRHTDEERKAMLEQMRKEQEQREAERREEATRRTERPAWHFPTPKPLHAPSRPAETQEKPAEPRPDATVQMPAVQPAPAPQPVEEPTRTMESVRSAPEKPAQPAAEKHEPVPQPQRQPTQPAPASQPAATSRRHAGLLRSRTEAEADLKEKIRSDHVWLSNPVMVRGLGLAPVVGAALDGERALILCVACLLLITFTRVLAVAVCHISNNRFRPIIYCYSAAILYIPVYILLYELFGNDLTMLGIYLPILIVEPAIVKRMEFTELEPVRDALRHGFNNGLGMCVALLIVGCLREFLATGAVFGQVIVHAALLPLAAQPAGGFVLVGVIAAVWCAVANAYTEYKQEEVRRLYADRKR